jgi:hypothetical protein
VNTETPDWHVVPNAAHPDTVLTDGPPGIETIWRVPYVIDSGPAKGARHIADVPAAMFHADGVKEAVMQHAANVHAVAQLAHKNA